MDHRAVTRLDGAPSGGAFPRRVRRALGLALIAVLFAPPALQAGLGKPKEAEAVETPELPLRWEQAWEAVKDAIEPYGIRSAEPARGQVISEYIDEQVGPNRYRTTVEAFLQRRGEKTAVTVRAQREIQMEALTPGAFAGGPKWQKVGGNRGVTDTVIAAILKTAGVQVPAATPKAPSPPSGPPPSPEAPVSPNWGEIQKLKAKRAEIMAPIRELDRRALEILYSPSPESRQKELDSIRAERMRLWETVKSQVMEIDQKILELALQE